MSKLQVLVATVNQNDCSLIHRMNLQCDAVIANQAGREELNNCQTQYGNIKMITTATRGVGLNRNIALLAAQAPLLLFADDDMVYYDGVPETVVRAFAENPKADVLVFGVDIVRDGKVVEKRHLQPKRLRLWNAMRFGTYRIAVRRSALVKNNILFNQNFGGGCPFSCGEDSLFLKACFDSGLKVYAHPLVLGTCAKDSSSWFQGYNEKFFYDKGVLMRYLFPRIPYLMAVCFGIKYRYKTDLSLAKRIAWMLKGVKGGEMLQPYHKGL